MATAAITLPRPRRAPRNQPVTGRAPLPEIYFVKTIDNSRLRREVDPSKRRQCFCLLGLGVLGFIFVFLFAHQHFQRLRYGYQIEQLKADRASLEEWNRQLRLEQARLADPQRIDTLARRQLGLVPAGARQVVDLGDLSAPAASPRSSEVASNFPARTPESPHNP